MTTHSPAAAQLDDATGVLSLGAFSELDQFNQALNISSWDTKILAGFVRSMLTIRLVERHIGDWSLEGKIKCPCHLGIGQEAVAVGVSHSLRPTDKVFGGHRSHSHYLALGGSVDEIFAEVLGKITGCSKGMGGSMHLTAEDKGFVGSVPIVAATIPIATGAALALKLDKSDNIAVSYFGDGSTEEGAFHESLNLAATHNLPVLFVCENNLYASHLDINLRQPTDIEARFAVAHGINHRVVDGNDVIAVAKASRDLIEASRAGKGPGFLEAVTYRWRGHVGPDENIDVGLRRKEEDIAAWKKRDPIRRLTDSLAKVSALDAKELAEMEEELNAIIEQAKDRAERAPYPSSDALLGTVYSDGGAE